MKTPFDDNTPRWRQSLLKLTRIVTIETRRRCMCIPTREDAKEEAVRLRRQYGDAVVAVHISKNGKGPTATYTCAYTLRETRTEELF
jgi:electron transfer flavoprotein alpha/beta subunit